MSETLRDRRGTQSYRDFAAALGIPKQHALLSKAERGLPISAASERTIGRALGVLPPARKVRRVSVAAIPVKAIRVCADLAAKFPGVYDEDAATVLQWLERVDRGDKSE